jgi:hypothetical protein
MISNGELFDAVEPLISKRGLFLYAMIVIDKVTTLQITDELPVKPGRYCVVAVDMEERQTDSLPALASWIAGSAAHHFATGSRPNRG